MTDRKHEIVTLLSFLVVATLWAALLIYMGPVPTWLQYVWTASSLICILLMIKWGMIKFRLDGLATVVWLLFFGPIVLTWVGVLKIVKKTGFLKKSTEQGST